MESGEQGLNIQYVSNSYSCTAKQLVFTLPSSFTSLDKISLLICSILGTSSGNFSLDCVGSYSYFISEIILLRNQYTSSSYFNSIFSADAMIINGNYLSSGDYTIDYVNLGNIGNLSVSSGKLYININSNVSYSFCKTKYPTTWSMYIG